MKYRVLLQGFSCLNSNDDLLRGLRNGYRDGFVRQQGTSCRHMYAIFLFREHLPISAKRLTMVLASSKSGWYNSTMQFGAGTEQRVYRYYIKVKRFSTNLLLAGKSVGRVW